MFFFRFSFFSLPILFVFFFYFTSLNQILLFLFFSFFCEVLLLLVMVLLPLCISFQFPVQRVLSTVIPFKVSYMCFFPVCIQILLCHIHIVYGKMRYMTTATKKSLFVSLWLELSVFQLADCIFGILLLLLHTTAPRTTAKGSLSAASVCVCFIPLQLTIFYLNVPACRFCHFFTNYSRGFIINGRLSEKKTVPFLFTQCDKLIRWNSGIYLEPFIIEYVYVVCMCVRATSGNDGERWTI